MNRSAQLIAVLAASIAAMVSGCGGASTPAPETVTVHDTPTSSSRAMATASVAASPAVPAPPIEAQSWVMPDLLGGNLQAAQDAIQALTGNPAFVSGSTDLTGQGRMQVMDRNWQVCTSTPAPGESFTGSANVNFGVVRDSESCP